ncbi:MAG: MoaD/ThiS family protein [Candidatus Ratteibacteria bacterium]
MVKVRIPEPLQKFVDNQKEILVDGDNIEELLKNIIKKYPQVKERIYDENGNLRRFINIYVNDEDIRFLEGEKTKLKDGDIISIIPAIAGGEKWL